ncbi:MAG: AAA family ATPase [candidate division NC10 bacterium]|nr:AAA family ATPase [candidate division NC10 bacterium]
MSYEQFYQLREQPFSNTPDPRFFFEVDQQAEVLARLMHAVNTMKGLAVVVGDVGTGKTTLARRMLDQLDDDRYESAMLVIIHSAITAEWLLRKIASQIGVEDLAEEIASQIGVEDLAEEKVEILSQIYQRLVELHQLGKKAVVLIDEANMLQQRSLMEELRGFLNLEVPGSKLITFILFGLSNLEENLALDTPLMQRVAVKCRLTSLKPEAVTAYIRHRLKIAGATREIFSEDVMAQIAADSRGIPRLINTIGDNVLLEGYLLKREKIDVALVRDVVRDLGLGT